MDYSDVYQAIYEIEGPRLSTTVSIASGFSTAVRLVLLDENVQFLIKRARTSKFVLGLLLNEIKTLSSQETDLRFKSPHDTALFALLNIVERADREYLDTAISLVSLAQGTWWAELQIRAFKSKQLVNSTMSTAGIDLVNPPITVQLKTDSSADQAFQDLLIILRGVFHSPWAFLAVSTTFQLDQVVATSPSIDHFAFPKFSQMLQGFGAPRVTWAGEFSVLTGSGNSTTPIHVETVAQNG